VIAAVPSADVFDTGKAAASPCPVADPAASVESEFDSLQAPANSAVAAIITIPALRQYLPDVFIDLPVLG
jgi:hypothetical protein